MPVPKSWKPCSFCSRQVYKFANPSRELCAACYYRERKNGDLAYKPVRVRARCEIKDCGKPAIAKKMCELHYRRFERHGVAENERFDKWGHKESHPLYQSHRLMVRNHIVGIAPEWEDFWKFAAAVGDRPSSGHKINRPDKSKPWGPDNFEWWYPKIKNSDDHKFTANEYARAYRAANPRIFKNLSLIKSYGVTIEWFDAKMAEQNGACAICIKPEGATDRSTGLPRNLAVDHCHKRGHNRGLLCSKCNTALGAFGDDPAILRAAIAYLEKHTLPDAAE